MSLLIIAWLTVALACYALLGVVFAVPYALFGVSRTDPAARNAGWAFRLLIVPGSAAFWPVLLVRWLTAGSTQIAGHPAHHDPEAETTV